MATDVTTLCRWPGVGSHIGFHHGYPCLLQTQVPAVSEWRIDLPFPAGKPPLSLNDRHAWQAHASIVARIKAITRNALRGADVPELGACHFELHYRGRTNAVRDADNYVATLKVCIDAAHQPDDRSHWVPILKGDDARYVSWGQPILHRAIKGYPAATWLILRSFIGPETDVLL